MENFKIIDNIHYYENKLDMNFLIINYEFKKFYNFGIKMGLGDYEWIYNDYKMFFTAWVKNIDSLLSNKPESILYFDGQGSFLVNQYFEIKQTSDVNIYKLSNKYKKYKLHISRNTLQNLRKVFQDKLTNIDIILKK